jgi:hypothetical protein
MSVSYLPDTVHEHICGTPPGAHNVTKHSLDSWLRASDKQMILSEIPPYTNQLH